MTNEAQTPSPAQAPPVSAPQVQGFAVAPAEAAAPAAATPASPVAAEHAAASVSPPPPATVSDALPPVPEPPAVAPPPIAPPPSPAAIAPDVPEPPSVVPPPSPGSAAAAQQRTIPFWVGALVAVVAVAALVLAWQAQQRARNVGQELARRSQQMQDEVREARLLAKQSQDDARESAAKAALIEARLNEMALQRGQLEELMQSLARSRDENVVVDIEAALRVAQRQVVVSGSVEPLVTALRQADERLARLKEPRLEAVRRAIARDLERAGAAGVVDLTALTRKIDDAIRLIDELPLVASAEAARSSAARAASVAPAASSAQPEGGGWPQSWGGVAERVWHEVRSLVRVTRVDRPEALLIAPEQAMFLRENLKLRLLNARLALLSRQFDATQADLQTAQAALRQWFDSGSRRVAQTSELLRQVAAQAQQSALPGPDETLAALSALHAVR